MALLPPSFRVEVFNVTEITYACQEAIGAPYRRPIVSMLPANAPPATPELIEAQLRAMGMKHDD